MTNWSICVLCQQSSEGHLTDRCNCTSRDIPKGYKSLADNLEELHCLSALPQQIGLSRLNDGSGIEGTLMRNSAKWHNLCWLLCSKTQVDRARRRKEKLQPTTNPSTPITSRLRATYPLPKAGNKNENICFFCDIMKNIEPQHLSLSLNSETSDYLQRCLVEI